MSKSPEVLTFGCRLNAYESEVIKGHATTAGWTDTVVINSCAVTKEAERQVRDRFGDGRQNHCGLWPRTQILLFETGKIGIFKQMALC